MVWKECYCICYQRKNRAPSSSTGFCSYAWSSEIRSRILSVVEPVGLESWETMMNVYHLQRAAMGEGGRNHKIAVFGKITKCWEVSLTGMAVFWWTFPAEPKWCLFGIFWSDSCSGNIQGSQIWFFTFGKRCFVGEKQAGARKTHWCEPQCLWAPCWGTSGLGGIYLSPVMGIFHASNLQLECQKQATSANGTNLLMLINWWGKKCTETLVQTHKFQFQFA